VGAYVRRELSGTDAALWRRVDVAYQDATGAPPNVAMPAMPLPGAEPPSQPGVQNLAQTMVIPGRSLRTAPTGELGGRRTLIIGLWVAFGTLVALLAAGIVQHGVKAAHQRTHSSPPAAGTLPDSNQRSVAN